MFQNVNNNNDRNNNNNNNNDNANMNMNPAKRKRRRVAMASQNASKKNALESDLARVSQLIQSPLNEVNLARNVLTSFIGDLKSLELFNK